MNPRQSNLRLGLLVVAFICLLLWLRKNRSSLENESTDPLLSHYDFRFEEDTPQRPIHKYDEADCPNYLEFSKRRHGSPSTGKRRYPYMRPTKNCRTFQSPALEALIEDLKSKMKDPDLARLMENTLPNTLDTTILWHKASSGKHPPQTFVVTGDIHAEWLRDSARQLAVFQPLMKYDKSLQDLIKGAIYTQADYLMLAPYCNAFHPPAGSGVKKAPSSIDDVHPQPSWTRVFECKYEIDSLASFLTLTNDYLENSDFDLSVIDRKWAKAFERILTVLSRESVPLFDSETGYVLPPFYSFKRQTNIGSETLPLDGVGNPVNYDSGLIRSAFRPSDDATVLQFFVPGNAHMLCELKRLHKNVLSKLDRVEIDLLKHKEGTEKFIVDISKGLKEHAIVDHPKWGKVFAYEVDGYGGSIFMDDANIPSLLSLPEMGYLSIDDEIYQNTRRMLLSKDGNPYFLKGPYFEGIGGPHIGLNYAWPMSLLVRIRTTDDDDEILKNLELLMDTTGGLGLMHEGVNVNVPKGTDYTRPWFAWCNSEFGKTILHLAKNKPHLIFKSEFSKSPYQIESVMDSRA